VVPIEDKPIMVSQVLKILVRFENQAVRKIKISTSARADNYDDVRELKTIQFIRKAIVSFLYNKPPKHHYTLDDLIVHTRINL
jgi:hypothetical protein